jgi:hypothetical protein
MKASKKVVCVFVDLQWGAKHADLAQQYQVRGFPTVIYTDSEGEEVARMEDRSSASMARDLTSLVKEHGGSSR